VPFLRKASLEEGTPPPFQSTMLALVPLLLLGAVSADSVLDLGDSDFDSKLADIETALVMFYAPWSVWAHFKSVNNWAGSDLGSSFLV
jgi:hypothetical protein